MIGDDGKVYRAILRYRQWSYFVDVDFKVTNKDGQPVFKHSEIFQGWQLPEELIGLFEIRKDDKVIAWKYNWTEFFGTNGNVIASNLVTAPYSNDSWICSSRRIEELNCFDKKSAIIQEGDKSIKYRSWGYKYMSTYSVPLKEVQEVYMHKSPKDTWTFEFKPRSGLKTLD